MIDSIVGAACNAAHMSSKFGLPHLSFISPPTSLLEQSHQLGNSTGPGCGQRSPNVWKGPRALTFTNCWQNGAFSTMQATHAASATQELFCAARPEGHPLCKPPIETAVQSDQEPTVVRIHVFAIVNGRLDFSNFWQQREYFGPVLAFKSLLPCQAAVQIYEKTLK
jgi:hypothetical protein